MIYYAVIAFTLDTEWFDICLCRDATSSSLNDKLHLKHFQATSDIR